MTYEEAIKILHPKTIADALRGISHITAVDMVEIANIMACEALEKQIPKKPIDNHHCPSCETGLPHRGITDEWCRCCFDPDFCPTCGQRLDWSYNT